MSGTARVLAILDLFSHQRPSWSPDEINETLQYSRPTGYRYVKELVATGLLQKTSAGRYSLGPRIIRLDYEIRQSDPVLFASMNVMAELATKTKLTAVLSAMYGHQVIDIHHAPPTTDMLPFPYARGGPRPLFRGAAPKVILPLLPRATLVRIYDAFSDEIASNGMGGTWADFRKHLSNIKKEGLYLSIGEVEPQVAGAAVPIVNVEGEVMAALALAGSVADFEKIGIAAIRELLVTAGEKVNAKLL